MAVHGVLRSLPVLASGVRGICLFSFAVPPLSSPRKYISHHHLFFVCLFSCHVTSPSVSKRAHATSPIPSQSFVFFSVNAAPSLPPNDATSHRFFYLLAPPPTPLRPFWSYFLVPHPSISFSKHADDDTRYRKRNETTKKNEPKTEPKNRTERRKQTARRA